MRAGDPADVLQAVHHEQRDDRGGQGFAEIADDGRDGLAAVEEQEGRDARGEGAPIKCI